MRKKQKQREEADQKNKESKKKKQKKKPGSKVDSEEVKNVQVDTKEVKRMQELMKTWSNEAPIKLTIKEKISKLNQLNTGGEESFESWKAARLAGGRKRKGEEGTNVDFEGSKRANVMANTETELETNLGKENINLK